MNLGNRGRVLRTQLRLRNRGGRLRGRGHRLASHLYAAGWALPALRLSSRRCPVWALYAQAFLYGEWLDAPRARPRRHRHGRVQVGHGRDRRRTLRKTRFTLPELAMAIEALAARRAPANRQPPEAIRDPAAHQSTQFKQRAPDLALARRPARAGGHAAHRHLAARGHGRVHGAAAPAHHRGRRARVRRAVAHPQPALRPRRRPPAGRRRRRHVRGPRRGSTRPSSRSRTS